MAASELIPQITPKKLEDYPTLKELSPETRILVESYERRISELLDIIHNLMTKSPERNAPLPQPFTGDIKRKLVTTSQVIAELERRSKLTIKDKNNAE